MWEREREREREREGGWSGLHSTTLLLGLYTHTLSLSLSFFAFFLLNYAPKISSVVLLERESVCTLTHSPKSCRYIIFDTIIYIPFSRFSFLSFHHQIINIKKQNGSWVLWFLKVFRVLFDFSYYMLSLCLHFLINEAPPKILVFLSLFACCLFCLMGENSWFTHTLRVGVCCCCTCSERAY